MQLLCNVYNVHNVRSFGTDAFEIGEWVNENEWVSVQVFGSVFNVYQHAFATKWDQSFEREKKKACTFYLLHI